MTPQIVYQAHGSSSPASMKDEAMNAPASRIRPGARPNLQRRFDMAHISKTLTTWLIAILIGATGTILPGDGEGDQPPAPNPPGPTVPDDEAGEIPDGEGDQPPAPNPTNPDEGNDGEGDQPPAPNPTTPPPVDDDGESDHDGEDVTSPPNDGGEGGIDYSIPGYGDSLTLQ